MGPSPNQTVIQPVTIDTMLNNNGLNIGNGLNFVICEQGREILFSGGSTISHYLAICF